MKRKKLVSTDTAVEMDMTPMIDVTFQLIIFFMVVTELSRMEVDQDVRLPHIDMSVLDREPDADRLILNVTRNGDITMFGRPTSLRELKARLMIEAQTDRPGPGMPSNRPIHIRCDRTAEFRHVEKILYYCTRENIRIWKISFGAAGEKTY